MIISRPSPSARPRLVRASAARLIAPGSCTRMSVRLRYRSAFVAPEVPTAGVAVAVSDMGDLRDQRLHLVGGGHGRRALAPRRHDGTGGIVVPQATLQGTAGWRCAADRAVASATGSRCPGR